MAVTSVQKYGPMFDPRGNYIDPFWYHNDPKFQSLRQELNFITQKIKTNDPKQYGWLRYNFPESGVGTSEQLADFTRSVQLGQELSKYYNNELQPPTQTSIPAETSSLIDIKIAGSEDSNVSPETQKNLEIVQEQAATGNVDSKQFLDSYVANAEPVVAQNQGPSTPVKYDEQMKQFVPNPGAGRPSEVRLKNPPFPLVQGPREEYMGKIASIFPPAMTLQELQQDIRSKGNATPGTKEYGELRDLQKEWIQRQKLKGAQAPETGPRGEQLIAQVLPTGPRGMDRAPGTYDNKNIIPLITPGSRFSDKEGYMIQDPFKNSPRTGPGLSERESRAVDVAIRTPDEQKASQAFQSEYDPQKARAAASAAKEYKKQFQAEDPFRSNAFG